MSRPEIAVLCADEDHDDLARLRDALSRVTGGACLVEGFRNGGRLAGRIEQLQAEGIIVPVVFVDETLMDGTGARSLMAMHETDSARGIRKVLLAASAEAPEVSHAIRLGAMDSLVPRPWTDQQLRVPLTRHLTEYFIDHDPAALERVPGLVDVAALAHAFSVGEERARVTRSQLEELQSSFFADDGMSDDDVERAMIEEIDRVLGRPERQLFPAGATLLHSGDPVGGIQIVLWGRVRLFRTVDGEEVTFHSRTAGRIIGLLGMARTQPAFFSCVAETDTEVIPLSFEQLSEALHRSPKLAVHFVSVLVRSLARRNLRSVELQLERDRLTRALEEEKEALEDALRRLEQAQTRLIESEKMATLGQLVAGIGHELNNPVTAITRAADFIARDVPRLVDDRPHAELLEDTLHSARTREPLPSREERRLRRELAAELGDDSLAQRLAAIGITSAGAYTKTFDGLDAAGTEALLLALETHHQLGLSIRGIQAGADRIAALVKSLRAYARGGSEGIAPTYVREGIEETLLLLGHRFGTVEVVTEYADLPPIAAYPGELNQVWTNLVTNAVQAMEGDGRLEITTSLESDGSRVRVDVVDSGPGIPGADIDKVFDLHFTTKHGRVEFGLGLGLRIAQDIVRRHGGEISVSSQPGRTRFSVLLPIAGHPEPVPEEARDPGLDA